MKAMGDWLFLATALAAGLMVGLAPTTVILARIYQHMTATMRGVIGR